MIFKRKKADDNTNPFTIQTGRDKLEKFSYRTGWTEESFVSGLPGKETIGRSFDSSRVRLAGIVFLIFLSLLVVRLAWLQLYKGEYYYRMAEGNRLRVERIEAKRGVIYDRNRLPLVLNKANFMLYVLPADLPQTAEELDRIIYRISEILGELPDKEETFAEPARMAASGTTTAATGERIRSILSTVERGTLEAFQPLYIADNIPYEKAILLSLEAANWRGVVLTSRAARQYNLPSLSLSHVLGYTGKINAEELEKFGDEYSLIDYIGKTGVENFWENELKGRTGRKQIEVDALGKEKKIISLEAPQDGRSLVLTVDAQAQKKLEEAVAVTIGKLKLNRAAAVALDPRNGEILAMVSLPTYDNNTFARGITRDEYRQLIENGDRPLYNRVISGEYPSGSTIKPVMAAAALEEGVITENTSVVSNGGLAVGEWFFPDWRSGGHGVTNVRKAIAQSVNTFFYYIGGGYQGFRGLGLERIVRYEKLFGLGEQTGIDLPSEARGFLPTKEWKEKTRGEKWYIGDTYHLSIGQGDLAVTPLQVAVFTSVFANGGKLYRPHLIKETLSNNEKTASPTEASPVRENFIKPENIEIVRQGMRETVTGGSARSLESLPVAVAGKTGTAQWSTKKPTHAWFTAFAPFESPQIVITVLVEEGGEGSSVAVPIAREFLNWYFSSNK